MGRAARPDQSDPTAPIRLFEQRQRDLLNAVLSALGDKISTKISVDELRVLCDALWRAKSIYEIARWQEYSVPPHVLERRCRTIARLAGELAAACVAKPGVLTLFGTLEDDEAERTGGLPGLPPQPISELVDGKRTNVSTNWRGAESIQNTMNGVRRLELVASRAVALQRRQKAQGAARHLASTAIAITLEELATAVEPVSGRKFTISRGVSGQPSGPGTRVALAFFHCIGARVTPHSLWWAWRHRPRPARNHHRREH